MKKIILASLCMLISIISYSQQITVIDKTTQQPLYHVSIYSNKPVFSSITNANGLADISGFKGGDTLFFKHLNYKLSAYSIKQIESMNYKVELMQKNVELDEIVISASKFEEKADDVAQPIEVISTREIEQLNTQTAADLLQQSGSVLVQKSQQGGGSPIIRGFEANKVLIVVDGIRMNNAIYRGGHLQNIIRYDNSMLERIEIAYGPSSVIYGSDALGGVMHIKTKSPIFSSDKILIKAQALTRYSSANNEATGHIDFNIGGKKLASFTSITYSNFGDLRQGAMHNPFYGDSLWKCFNYAERINGVDSMIANNNPNVQLNSGYTQYNILEKLSFKSGNHITHTLNLQFTNSSDVPRYDRLTEYSSGELKYTEWYYGPEQQLLAAYQLHSTKATKLFDQLNTIVAFQDLQESRISRRFAKTAEKSQIEDVNVFSLNADFSKFVKKNELRYGLEALFNTVASQAFHTDIETGEQTPTATRYPDGGSTMLTAALYITDAIEFSEKFIVNGGIRFSHVTLHASFQDTSLMHFPFTEVSQSNQAITGSVGSVLKPGQGWNFSMVLSTGFRAPNVDDLGKVFDSNPGKIIVPNPHLKPEYAYNADFGIQKNFKDNITISTTVFYTMLTNVISILPYQFNGEDSIIYDGMPSLVTASQNSNEAYIYGANAVIEADLTDYLSFSSSLTYTYGRIKTDTVDYPLDHIPPLYGKTSAIFKVKKCTAEFYALYNGWKYLKDYNLVGEDNMIYATIYGMPAWFTLNVKTSIQLSTYIQFQAGIENMLDQNYRVFGSGISAPGRNVVLSLRGTF